MDRIDALMKMKLSKIYPLLVNKVVKKGRLESEVESVIYWLLGYDAKQIQQCLVNDITYGEFFMQAPCINRNRYQIKGSICGVKIESLQPGIYQDMRILDKLIDDLAKGKSLEQILV